MRKVALYERVLSEEMEGSSPSLAEQDRALTKYAEVHNMTIVDRYVDGGKKKSLVRPERSRLLSDVEAGKIDTVLFTSLNMWCSAVPEYFESQSILDAHKVDWIATEEDYETVTSTGKFKVNILFAVLMEEAERNNELV